MIFNRSFCHEAREAAFAAEAAQSRCALTAAAQGRPAWQVDWRIAARGQHFAAQARARPENVPRRMSAKGRPERGLRPPGGSDAVKPRAWGEHSTLSRRDLEEGRMREVYVEALADGHALTDEELSASLTATLNAKPKGAGWWVFAYGSLLWNPLFPFAEARRASVHGFHRRFCL